MGGTTSHETIVQVDQQGADLWPEFIDRLLSVISRSTNRLDVVIQLWIVRIVQDLLEDEVGRLQNFDFTIPSF